ncbi:MAG: phenylalanine--tRNA ligase subunit alpha [Candidatus Saccharibacteria bacterium]
MTSQTNILKNLEADLKQASNEHAIAQVKSKYLGSNSFISEQLRLLPGLSTEEKAKKGKDLNVLKNQIEHAITEAREQLVASQQFPIKDISLPGERFEQPYGHMHPASRVLQETYKIFSDLGFAVVDSSEIETDWYNFEALNMPASHPAREMQDTFYIKNNGKLDVLPRTHTSGMQVRFMEANKPPFKIIVPGRVFRNEDEDVTHIWAFHQIEGLVVGEGVSMAQLKGTLLHVVQGILGPEADIRFRPSYFPYTEPSVELDCRYKGQWLELGGAGMINPVVLQNGGIDPEKYTGFAFGWGAERIAAIKYGLDDLRELWRPRFEFLEQFV